MANRLVDSTDINGYPLDEIITATAPFDLPKGDRGGGGGKGRRKRRRFIIVERMARIPD